MRSGTWDGALSDDNVRVSVNGERRPVRSVRIQSGMRDGSPRAESQAWCVESTIEWESPHLVTGTSPHLFGGGRTDWLPKAGDEVTIETGDGAQGKWWMQHRGVIDETSGSIAEGTAQSTTVDMIEDLDVTVTQRAMLQRMTPRTEGAGYRRVGLQSTWLIDKMLRAGGWHTTPPASWDAIAAMHGQGSLWPEVGRLLVAHRIGNTGTGPAWTRTPTGLAPIRYTMRVDTTRRTARPVVTIGFEGPNISGGTEGEVQAVDAIGRGFFIGYRQSDDVIIVGTINTSGRTLWSRPRQGATRAALYAQVTSGTRQSLVIRYDNGYETTLNPSTSGIPEGWTCTQVRVNNNSRIGWWTVEDDPVEGARWNAVNHRATARLRLSETLPWWTASRDVIQENAAEWLQAQADAEGAAMWLDEDGVMQWAGRGVLEGGSAVRTVTSVLDVDDIQWEMARNSMARSVTVAYEAPRIEMSYNGAYARDLWVSDNTDAGVDEPEVITVTPPDDQDWIDVDTDPHHVTRHGLSWTHYTHGSIFGGTQYDKNNSSDGVWANFLDCTMTQDGLREFTITYGPWSTIGASQRVKSSYPPNPGAFMRDGGGVLALRSIARTIWVPREMSLSSGSGVGRAVMNHDVGWRVQRVNDDNDALDDLIKWLRSEVGAADRRPYVTGLTIAHDPRLQVGDKIRVRDTAITGVDFDMIIQERSVDVDEMTETISGRVTLVRIVADYGDFVTDWESRLEPSGPTATTRASNWTRTKEVT